MTKKEKRILSQLKKYVRIYRNVITENNIYFYDDIDSIIGEDDETIAFDDDALFYVQSNICMENDIEEAVEQITTLIAYAEQHNKLLYNKKFNITNFRQVTNKIQYMHYINNKNFRWDNYNIQLMQECNLSKEFYLEFYTKMENGTFFKRISFTEEFLNELLDKDNKKITQNIFFYQKLSIEFIIKHINKIEFWWMEANKQINKQELEMYNIEMLLKMRDVA